MRIIDADKRQDIKRLALYLDPNEAEQFRDQLAELLKSPESKKQVHIQNASGEIYCGLAQTEKEFLEDAKKYLQGAVLRWKKWEQESEGWDHDHCAICFKVFDAIKKDSKNLKDSTKESPAPEESLQEGYVTEDNMNWICKECYEKFEEEFQFKVIDPPK